MNWQDLGVAVSLYNKRRPMFPSQPLNPYRGSERHYLMTIQNPTAAQIKKFLNSWGRMRMSFNVNKIQQAIEKSKIIINNLKGYDFVTADLPLIEQDIVELFNNFLHVGSKRSPIAASKAIHVLLPNLLLMWDGAIKTGYGCGFYKPLKNKTYAKTYFIFLSRVQSRLINTLSLYLQKCELRGILQASTDLRNRFYQNGIKPITKIVDEYNFQKYTQGSNFLW